MSNCCVSPVCLTIDTKASVDLAIENTTNTDLNIEAEAEICLDLLNTIGIGLLTPPFRNVAFEPDAPNLNLNMVRMNGDYWKTIYALGRGPNPGEIIFVGDALNGPGGHRDIGILNTTTGDVTEYWNSLDISMTGGQAITPAGIDCDRATGRIVVTNKQAHANNFYPSWYADSPAGPWTYTSTPTTQFSGGDWVRHDVQHQIWYMHQGNKLFVSIDGASWVQQQYRIIYNESLQNVPQIYGEIVESIMNPLDSNAMMWAGA